MQIIRIIATFVVLAMVNGDDCSNPGLNVTSNSMPSLVEGQNVTLFCAVGLRREVNFRLINTSKPLVSCSATSCSDLSSTGVYPVSRNDSGVALTITHLDRKRDGNTWVCVSGEVKDCYDLHDIIVPIRAVSISIGKAPAYSNPSHTLVVPTGTQEFRCQTDRNGSRPHATFQWYLIQNNGTLNQSLENVTMSVNKSMVNPDLVVSESTVQIQINRSLDGWILRCSAGNNFTVPASVEVKLNVIVPIRNVTISQGSATTRGEVTGDSGSLQGFSCRTNPGSPHATFHWRLIQATGTTTELVPNSTVYTNATGDPELVTSVGTLRVMFNRSMNGASLECSATNNNITSSATDSVKLNVLYGPSSVTIQGTKQYPLGSNVTGLTCMADCNPACSFQWSNMGQVVKNTSVLSIPRLTNKTAGMYTCVVAYNWTLTSLNKSVFVNVSATASKTPPSTPTKFPIIPVAAGAGGGVLVLVIIVVVVVVVCKKKKRKAQVEAKTAPVAEKTDSTTGSLVYAYLEMSAKQSGDRQKKGKKKKEEDPPIIHGERSSIQYAEIMISDKSRPP